LNVGKVFALLSLRLV